MRPKNKKTRKKRITLLLLPMVAVLFFWGCETQYPPTSALYSGPDRTLVCDFEGSATVAVNVNPNLYELGMTDGHVKLPGTASPQTVYANPASLVVFVVSTATPAAPVTTPQQGVTSPGYDGTGGAYHILAQVNQVSSSGVTDASIFFNIKPETANNGFYNGSVFKGIEFYIKVGTADGASSRYMTIPIAQTKGPSEGGLCTGVGCWANFSYTLPANPDGQWHLYDVAFTNFTRPTWGKAMTPSDLSGDNLTKILSFQISESGPNIGSYFFDYWVDQVRLYY
jgi:hypothetical protein